MRSDLPLFNSPRARPCYSATEAKGDPDPRGTRKSGPGGQRNLLLSRNRHVRADTNSRRADFSDPPTPDRLPKAPPGKLQPGCRRCQLADLETPFSVWGHDATPKAVLSFRRAGSHRERIGRDPTPPVVHRCGAPRVSAASIFANISTNASRVATGDRYRPAPDRRVRRGCTPNKTPPSFHSAESKFQL